MNNQFLATSLQGLGQGLMAAGGGGWSQFAPGLSQGLMQAQNTQLDRLDREERRRLRELQEQQLQMQLEQQRTANQDAVKEQQDWQSLFQPGMMAPPSPNFVGPMPQGGPPLIQGLMQGADPAQIEILKRLGPDAGKAILAERAFAQPKERAGINIGGVLVDPITGQKIADYSDVIRQNNAAGKSSTSVNVNLPKSINAGDEKLMQIGAEGLVQGQEILPLFNIAREAAKDFPQSGPLGGAALTVERLKNYMGMENNASAGEVLQGMQTRLGTLLRVPGSGATSNMEMSLYMQGVPGLLNSQEGNIALATIGEKLVQKRIQNYQKLQQYIVENGSSVGYMPDETPVLTPQETALLQGGTAAPAEGADLSTMSDDEILRDLGVMP